MSESSLPQSLSSCNECQLARHNATAGIRPGRDCNNRDPKSLNCVEISHNGSRTDLNSINSETAKHTKPQSRNWTKTGLKSQISFARSKSLQQLIVEDKEKLRRAHKAQDAKSLKLKRDAEIKAKNDQKKADKEMAKRYNKEKKRRQAEEERNSMKWGGIVRGFDPNAGLLRSTASEDTLPHPEARVGRGQQNDDSLVDILHPKLDKGQTWGVEHGAPGKKARFGISSSNTGGGSGFGSFDGGGD